MTTRKAPRGDMSKSVGYLRVSKADGSQELGPLAQRTSIERWASANGVEIIGWFEDHLTGATEVDDRPALMEALAALRANKVGLFAVAKRDRIARDVFVTIMIERAVEAAGARAVSADGINGDDAGSTFARQVQDAASQYERSLIRARTRAALAVKKAKGERTGTVRFGYRLAEDGVRLVEDEGEQTILSRVRSLRSDGMSIRQIVAALSAQGVTSRTGRPLAITQVGNIIRAA